MPIPQPPKVQTIIIDNFMGSLTRKINGDLRSGLAKFYSSWGYNPFVKPGNLTWNLTPANITGSLNGLLVAGQNRVESGVGYTYGITNTGHFVKITIDTGAISDLHTMVTGTPTFLYGAALEFYNGKVWITNDKGISRIDFDGTNETQVGTWNSSNFIQATYHPLSEFQGKLYVGNTTDGTSTNIGEIDTTNLIVAQSKLSPALPTGTYVRDMDVTSDFVYLVISASEIPQEAYAAGNDTVNSFAANSFRFLWNGTDTGVTSGTTLPNFGITALNNFGDTQYSFMYDSMGASLYDSGRKVLTIQDNKSPLPNATAATGNMVTWCSPEIERTLDPVGQESLNSMYFFGQLDAESPVGFWRMFRQSSDLAAGSVNQVPYMSFIKNQYVVVASDGTLSSGASQQMYSRLEFNSGGTTNELFTFSFAATPDVIEETAPVLGVYETQTQIFEKKVNIVQIRVYTEPTATGNGFDLDIIDTDGTVGDSGAFSYTFAPGSDITALQGILDRINFNPKSSPSFGFGLRITNTGTTNMTIKKIEIDITESGK